MAESRNTLANKLAKVAAQIAELRQQRDVLRARLENFFDPASVKVGDVVTFTLGRGQFAQPPGTVLGLKEADGKVPARAKIAVGEGFDSRVETVAIGNIIGVVTITTGDTATDVDTSGPSQIV